jgi:hypothetical protein
MLAIFVYAMIACLGLNDAVKVAMIRWRVPAERERGSGPKLGAVDRARLRHFAAGRLPPKASGPARE